MSLVHATSVRTAIAQAVSDYAGASAKLNIYNASNTLLVTVLVTLGTAVSGVCTVDPAAATVAASGVADHAKVYKNDGTTLVLDGITVTATGGGGDIELANTTLTSGNSFDLSAFSYTAPS